MRRPRRVNEFRRLARLAREGLVDSEWVESSQGPPRKYYSLTASGRASFESLQGEFRGLVQLVEGAGSRPAAEARERQAKKITIRREHHE